MMNISTNYAVYEMLFLVLDLTNTAMVRNREFVSEKFDVDRTCAGASRKFYSTNIIIKIIIISATPVQIMLMVASNTTLCLDWDSNK
jgi:hypothetical protein